MRYKVSRGSTLLELLIYIALLGVVLTIFASMYVQLVVSKKNNQARTAVTSNISFATTKINQDIELASVVQTPGLATTSSELWVVVNGEDIRYCVAAGQLRRDSQGACTSASPAITTSDVQVGRLEFTHIENENTVLGAATISVKYALTVSASSTAAESEYTTTYQTSVLVQ